MPLYHHNITNSQPIDSSPINPTSDNYKGWTMSTNSVRLIGLEEMLIVLLMIQDGGAMTGPITG